MSILLLPPGQCVKSIYTFNAVSSLCFVPEGHGYIVTGSGVVSFSFFFFPFSERKINVHHRGQSHLVVQFQLGFISASAHSGGVYVKMLLVVLDKTRALAECAQSGGRGWQVHARARAHALSEQPGTGQARAAVMAARCLSAHVHLTLCHLYRWGEGSGVELAHFPKLPVNQRSPGSGDLPPGRWFGHLLH